TSFRILNKVKRKSSAIQKILQAWQSPIPDHLEQIRACMLCPIRSIPKILDNLVCTEKLSVGSSKAQQILKMYPPLYLSKKTKMSIQRKKLPSLMMCIRGALNVPLQKTSPNLSPLIPIPIGLDLNKA